MDRMNEPVARSKIVGTIGVLFVGLWLMPAAAWAQNTGIAGVVRDSSGGVLPGVTVEASSPALIEKVRTVVTDGQGLYSIVDLRPGTYTVTFTLPGFSTVRREGIELTTSFTATVNAELTVGGVQETITVSGEAPTVDTRNVVQAQVLGEEIREAVPTARSAMGMAELIPGITVTAVTRPTGVGHDVVGVADARGAINFHGSKNIDNSLQLDGTQLDKAGNGTTSAWQAIPSEVREYVYEVAAMSAETMGGGVRVQVVPKEGGNRFSLYAFSAFTNPALQRGNLSQKLIDLGVPTP
ncbi:MAG: carboxypeptidase regulatory-like domain-containing protein, partial [Armatimonadetes bacterium]|nr:carboxypeptidase regulatory-like domain-containing protein [Armatimonadota bacterium]